METEDNTQFDLMCACKVGRILGGHDSGILLRRRPETLKQTVQRVMKNAIKKHDGNYTAAAKELGVARNRLYAHFPRKAITALLLFCFTSVIATPTVTASWGTYSNTITNYAVVYGTSSGNYTQTNNTGTNLSCVISNLHNAKYYFAYYAQDRQGLNTELSEEVFWTLRKEARMAVTNSQQERFTLRLTLGETNGPIGVFVLTNQ